jgi:hypothetical protein
MLINGGDHEKRRTGSGKENAVLPLGRMSMEMLLNLLWTNGDWVVAIARIVLGVILFAHGAQKLLG